MHAARERTAEQVEQLVASIKEWGWTSPVLLDEAGGIIAGHGRVLAAKKLGLADVPCMVVVGWTEAQRKAYVIADNKLALGAGWDETILRTEFATLQELEFDVGLTSFTGAEIGALMALGSRILMRLRIRQRAPCRVLAPFGCWGPIG
jgi:ParB-like chromosome segregation protein Spo0J